jgi:hypothetical protein
MSLDAAETKSPTRARSWLLVVLAVVVWSSGTPPDRDVRAARLRFIAARVIEARATGDTVNRDPVAEFTIELVRERQPPGPRGQRKVWFDPADPSQMAFEAE